MVAHAKFNHTSPLLGVLMFALVGLTGCATPDYPLAPREAATPDYKYVIGPLDIVNIIVWRNPELSMSVPVRPDGRITTPLVEDVPALGKDSTTLARDIEKALAKYIRDPVVTVIVTEFQGPYDQTIRVIGEAAKPADARVSAEHDGARRDDRGRRADGLRDGNAATILRTAEGGKIYGVKLRDLVKRGDFSANVDVKPGDILIIPQSWF